MFGSKRFVFIAMHLLAQADPDTAQAATAQADALTGKDTAPSAAVTGTTALRNAQTVPTTAVQAAWFGGLDFILPNGSAQAAKMTIRLVGFGDVACREEPDIAWADIHPSKIALECCRGKNDHNTALKYLRRLSEVNAAPLIELAQKTLINEIQYAWYGPEYAWWHPLPGQANETVTFLWSWLDLLKSLDKQSKLELFGDGDKDKHKVKACFFLAPAEQLRPQA